MLLPPQLPLPPFKMKKPFATNLSWKKGQYHNYNSYGSISIQSTVWSETLFFNYNTSSYLYVYSLVDSLDQSETLPSLCTFPDPSLRAPSLDSDASSSTHRPPTEKGYKSDEVDNVVVTSLKGIQERWTRKDADKLQSQLALMDEEGHFGHQVAASVHN